MPVVTTALNGGAAIRAAPPPEAAVRGERDRGAGAAVGPGDEGASTTSLL